MATSIVDSFLVALGYEYDDKDYKKFAASTKALNGLLKSVMKVAAGATVALGGMIAVQATATDETAKQARQLRMAVDEFDALKFAAGQSGIATGTLASNLETLSIRASEAARGIGSGVEAFGMLGISVTEVNGDLKSTDVLLREASDALNNMGDQGQRLELADKLGLKDINLLLEQGSTGINQLTAEARELGVVTAADAKAAEDFVDEWARFRRTSAAVLRTIATQVLPVITDLMQTWREWVKQNKKMMSSGLVGWLMNLGNVLQLIKVAMMGIIGLRIITLVLTLTKAIRTLGMTALLANAKVLAIPLAIAAAIALVGLAIEDIFKFVTGQESLIGKLLDSDMLETVKGRIDDFTTWMADKIKSGLATVKNFFIDMAFSFINIFIDGINVAIEQLKNIPGLDNIETIQRLVNDTDKPMSVAENGLGGAGLLGMVNAAHTIYSSPDVKVFIDGASADVVGQLQNFFNDMASQAESNLQTQ